MMLDNIADLLMTVGLLWAVFEFPTDFALRHMVPGTAIGVLLGDLLFFRMALTLARRTGRNDVTAMPLGLDTPSTLGMVFFVLGPAFLHAKNELQLDVNAAATYAWQIGICAIFVSGLFKLACALGAGWLRRMIPRAGLLGSLAAIALVLISFLPLMEVLHSPVVGLLSLSVILTALVARVRLPGRIPGALGALLIGGAVYYLMCLMQWTSLLGPMVPQEIDPSKALLPFEWLAVFRFEWLSVLRDSLHYMPVVIPFALATVIGGIDCTESAAAAGDEYDTKRIIAVEALATLAASLCGGVIQTTPYIGHPAYKAMGGRAAYTLATALFVGSAGLVGYFGYLYVVIPKVTVFPILVFIGLEITAQSFQATPKRHYAAIAMACIPALAALAWTYVDRIFADPVVQASGLSIATLGGEALRYELLTLRVLANGFILTSLLWASALAALIDRRLWLAAAYFAVCSACSFFGVIHSPLPGGPMFLPWRLASEASQMPLRFGCGYLAVVLVLFAWGLWRKVVEEHSPVTRELEP